MKLTASEYLHSMLKGPIQQILESPESCEVGREREGVRGCEMKAREIRGCEMKAREIRGCEEGRQEDKG